MIEPDDTPFPPIGGISARPPTFAEELGRVLFPGAFRETGSVSHDLLARIAGSYDFTLRAVGPKPPAVLWRDRRNQRARFKALLQVLGDDARTPGLTINDFGCGYGALFAYIRRQRFMMGGRYVGYDLSPGMVRAARHLFRRDPRASFVHAAEPTEEADYSFASGTWGLKLDARDADWSAYVRHGLRRLAAATRRGMAFNLLDARGPDRRPTLYYADPEEYLDFCRKELGGHALMIDTDLPGDFTILVRFDGRMPAAGRRRAGGGGLLSAMIRKRSRR